MNDADTMPSNDVEAVLQGGPTDIGQDVRLCRVGVNQVKVKVEHLGGYEHFERSTDDASGRAVFRWTMRTKIAE